MVPKKSPKQNEQQRKGFLKQLKPVFFFFCLHFLLVVPNQRFIDIAYKFIIILALTFCIAEENVYNGYESQPYQCTEETLCPEHVVVDILRLASSFSL